jgi:hypothetical protein
VYEITKLTMENNERMVSIHKAARFSIPENYTKNKVLPWHKGAARWFNENGYTIEQHQVTLSPGAPAPPVNLPAACRLRFACWQDIP